MSSASDRLTKAEQDRLIKEVAQRCRDMIYMNAEKIVRQAIGNKLDMIASHQITKIELIYTINIGGPDLVQILGRIRRGSKVKP